ncbi:MAG: hypothetical protein H6767_01990 [Candidatus Peribacteria bacterium]|nr:MAG: hypothetical protein H6767_01990 [Candidatus Peribacteria bacterium]
MSGVVEASSFQNADATVVGNTAVFEAVTPSQASYDIDVFGKNNGTNQWYTIPFSIEKLDPDNVYDHTTYTFTAPAT